MQQIHQQERAGGLPEDVAKRAGDQLQKITDAHTQRIDAIAGRKESEVMEV
jgi:ribosome recycling factor